MLRCVPIDELVAVVRVDRRFGGTTLYTVVVVEDDLTVGPLTSMPSTTWCSRRETRGQQSQRCSSAATRASLNCDLSRCDRVVSGGETKSFLMQVYIKVAAPALPID